VAHAHHDLDLVTKEPDIGDRPPLDTGDADGRAGLEAPGIGKDRAQLVALPEEADVAADQQDQDDRP
jgi:hypothetical protein